MKKSFVVIGLAILLLMATVSSVSAALPGSGWWVYYMVQNVDTVDGTLAMQAYRSGDATAYTGSCPLNAGRSLSYHPGQTPSCPTGTNIGFTPSLPTGFAGSVVLSSDVPVVAVAQLGNNPSGTVGVTGGTATSFYQGIGGDLVANKLNFPSVKHNYSGQTTTFYVQAAGVAASVTITYTMNDGTIHKQTTTIPANEMFVFDPANATPAVASTGCTANPSPCMGAAVVTSSSGPIAGVVVEAPHTGSPAPVVLSTRGFTPNDEDTTILAPVIKNASGSSTTGWTVQNVGTITTTVNVTFTVITGGTPGTQYVDSEVVGPSNSVVFSPSKNNMGGMPTGVYASGMASASQPLVGTVNESKDQAGTPGGKIKSVYSCFGQSNATDTVALPMIKEMFGNKTTGVTVMNAGTADTQFIATYTDSSGNARVFQTVATDIGPGEAVSFFQVYTNPGGKFSIVSGMSAFSELQGTLNSAIITTSNGQPIVAIASETDRASTPTLDFKNYEGFNLN